MNNIYIINMETMIKQLKIKKLDFLFLLRKFDLIDNWGMGKGIIKIKIIYNYTKNGRTRNIIHFTTPLGAAVIATIIANNYLNFK